MSNSSYCQQNPLTRQAGNQVMDRSVYLPFGTQYMTDQSNNPTMPAEWQDKISNQAVFNPRGVNSLYSSSMAPPAGLSNGFGTWLPNIVPPSTPTPVFNQAPALSSGVWMVYDPPKFQYDHKAYCQVGQLASQPGFTPMCSNGQTPTCNVSGATGATGSAPTYGGVDCGPNNPTLWGDPDPIFVANKYTYAMRNNYIVNQNTQTNNQNWSNVAFDLSDCGGGVPCSCVDSTGMAIPGLAPLVTANSTMSNGLFSYSQQSCANGTPAMQETRTSQGVSASVPVYWTSFSSNGINVPDASDAVCPVNTMPACASIKANVVPDETSVLYPLCNMQTDTGEKYQMVPLCKDTSVPVWKNNQFNCPGVSSAQVCKDGSQPTAVLRAKCDDGTAPSCISKPFCNASGDVTMGPVVPDGYQLKGYSSGTNTWSYAGYSPGQNPVTPTCNYFGMKQTDICPCSCIVDSLGAPIPEGVPVLQDGIIQCPDKNTEPDCTNMAVGAQCLDGNNNFLGFLPICSDKSRAYYDLTKQAVVCDDGTTPSCPSGQTAQPSGIYCLDQIAQTGTMSFEPVRCYSSIMGNVCQASKSVAPISSGGDNIVCPSGYELSCPGVDNPVASSVCQGVNLSPVCVSQQSVCSDVYMLPEFGVQAIQTPIDSRQVSNQSVLFCSNTSGVSNSCNTILSHYFPEFAPPPGVPPSTSTSTQLLVPDPMTAGGLSQGICLSSGNVIPSDPSKFSCASSTNPPTALTQWNSIGQGQLSAVPVGEPFALNQDSNKSYPTEQYFNNTGTAAYDHGLIYYLNQTCSQDSSGACTSSQLAGIPMAQGHMRCPKPGEKVKTIQTEKDTVSQFKAVCEDTGVFPIVTKADAPQQWSFPAMFSPNKVEACPADHVLASLDETEPIDYDPYVGVWRGERTGRSAVCVPKSKAHDVKAAVNAAMPFRPCMNQPGLDSAVTFPGQGHVDAIFEYDPLVNTCRQKVVCQDGICQSNLQAESVVDYHQGLTIMNKAINYPAIQQNESSFPVEMFGDLGQPGVMQKLNPSMYPIQPAAGEAGLQVPEGYLYWPRNQDKSLQNQTKHAVGQVLYGYWTIFTANNRLTQNDGTLNYPQAFSTFDKTGAGWNQATQIQSKGTSADIYEDTYAPSVLGPLMSGPMTGNDTSQIGQLARTIMPFYGTSEGNINDSGNAAPSYDYLTKNNNQNKSLPWPLFAQKTPLPLDGPAVQISTTPVESVGFPTWQLGFGRCDVPCNSFYYTTAALPEIGTSTVPSMTQIPLFTLGNIPNDSSVSCTNSNFDASAMLGNVLVNSCSAANGMSSLGVDSQNMPAYQCIAQCDGKQYIMSKYSWQGLNSSTNTPDQLCNPSNVKKEFADSGVCQSDDIYVWPVNSNQSNCVGC